MEDLIDIYQEFRECDYKGEHYSVRDNGAIMRHPNGVRKRPTDGIWTFGRKDDKSGYMIAFGERAHIIVATAFHGAHDTKILVVDHIDTNRCNNRPENLRWLTRLENILLNEYTRSKVEYICGSIENFLANPQLLYGHEYEDSNFAWMRTVTKEEAENTRRNLDQLQRREKPKVELPNGTRIDERIYESWQEKKRRSLERALHSSEGIEPAITVNHDPMNPTISNPLVWSMFPRLIFHGFPTYKEDNPLQTVFDHLPSGSLFCEGPYATYRVVERALYEDALHLMLQDTDGAVKPWAYYRVWWDNDHYRVDGQMCFEEIGARALYCRAQNIPGYEDETLDDACM